MLYLLAVITILAAVSQYAAFRRMLGYVRRELAVEPGPYLPKVSLILPCKGLDADFAANIRKLLGQEYCDAATGRRHFEVVFAVGSKDDPAYAPLLQICEQSKDVRVDLVVAEPSPYRADKVNNQLAALKHVSADTEVYVFVDADVIARDDCLRYLVAPLQDKGIGVTTGYRFYIPFKGDWPSLIRSLWNRISAWEMADPAYAFAWGGAMATRRETFDKANVSGSWERSADDDLALTTAIKKLGLKVHFVPQCLVASHGDASFQEITEWMNRQLILTKVYYPALWRRAIARTIVLTVWLVAVLISAVGAIAHNHQMFVALLVGLSLLPVEWAFLFKAQGLWKQLLKANMGDGLSRDVKPPTQQLGNGPVNQSLEDAYNRSFWRFSATLPLAHLVLPWMTLYSILTNRITWRGITYELRSPTETVII